MTRGLTWLVLAMLMAWSGTGLAQTAPKRGGVFRIAAVDPPALDPHLTPSFMTQTLGSLVYSHLVRFPAGPEQTGPEDFRILPDLAEKWQYTSPTRLVFTLRKGARFHRKAPVNGREVTAEDVKYSLDRFRTRAPFRGRLEAVQAVDVLDRYTVRLTLKEPQAPLLNYLAAAAFCAILPREAEERFKDFNAVEAVIGTGPFVLKSYERGVRVTFERNPDYFMPGLPYLDGVLFEIVPEELSRISLLRAGKVEMAHWWGWLNPENGRALKRTNPEMVITTRMVIDLAHIFMRTDQPPFNDVRVRRAVSLAIDRLAWRDTLHYGEGCLDSGPVPCAMTELKLDPATLEPGQRKYVVGYDPVEARRLLAEAGFPRGLTTPLFHWPGFAAPWRSYYDLTVDNLARVGITAELKAEELGKFTSTTSVGKYEKMAMGPYGAGSTEVDDFLYGHFFPGAPYNRSHVADPALDTLILAQRREMDPNRRRDIIHEIQHYLADKVYYVYLPMYPRYIAHPPHVKGFKPHDGFDLGRRLTYTWLDR